MKISARAALTAALLASAALPAAAEPVFNRIASFPVAANLLEGEDKATSSEIITATPDGNTLVYSDAPGGRSVSSTSPIPRLPRPAVRLRSTASPIPLPPSARRFSSPSTAPRT